MDPQFKVSRDWTPLKSFVRCDIGHGLTESNRNDTARTSSLARRLTDRTFLHKLNRMERWRTTLTYIYDKEGKGEKRRREREEDVSIPVHDLRRY